MTGKVCGVFAMPWVYSCEMGGSSMIVKTWRFTWRFSRQVLVVLSVVAITNAEAYSQNVTSASSEDQKRQLCEQNFFRSDRYVPSSLWFSDAFHKARDMRSKVESSIYGGQYKYDSQYEKQLERLLSRAEELYRRIDILRSRIQDIVVFESLDFRCPNGDVPLGHCFIPNCREAPSAYQCIEKDLTALKDKHTRSVKKLGRVFMQTAHLARRRKPSGRNNRRPKIIRRRITEMKAEIGGYQSKYAVAYDCET